MLLMQLGISILEMNKAKKLFIKPGFDNCKLSLLWIPILSAFGTNDAVPSNVTPKCSKYPIVVRSSPTKDFFQWIPILFAFWISNIFGAMFRQNMPGFTEVVGFSVSWKSIVRF